MAATTATQTVVRVTPSEHAAYLALRTPTKGALAHIRDFVADALHGKAAILSDEEFHAGIASGEIDYPVSIEKRTAHINVDFGEMSVNAVSAFAERCPALAARHGAGFKLDESVIACLQAHQPRW
jgi:hypothetical protein